MADLGAALLALARQAIADGLGLPPGGDVSDLSDLSGLPRLQEPGATFVTLKRDGNLRGCIGSLEAYRPLAEDVRENARSAAFHDPRFPPLDRDEWAGTRIEVSLLTPARPLQFEDEADAQAQLRPGIDGVVLTAGFRRATFLPQVWEQLPQPSEFLAQLKRKAGLPAGYWGPEMQLERYEVMKWQEQ